MREIKYRAWLPEWEMVTVSSVDMYDGKATGIMYIGDLLDGQADNFELMQWTGLVDKNGVDIYEGDVLSDTHKRTFEVRWQSGYEPEMEVGFWLKKTYTNEIFPFHYTKDIGGLGMEVIGNIYENPELLK